MSQQTEEQPLHPHSSSAPYDVPIPTGTPSSEPTQPAPRRSSPEPEARERVTSWGSYNQFVGTSPPSTSTPQFAHPYDPPSHSPSSPHYRLSRMSQEADIAEIHRLGGPGSSSNPGASGGVIEVDEVNLKRSKTGNKLRRVKQRVIYNSDGKPRRQKRDKYGVKDIPEGWSKEDEEAEREFLASSMFNWQELMTWRFWIRKEWWYWYILAVVIGVLVILMTIYHDDIVKWLTPAANWMKKLPAGWVIPIAVMFILSFPPLFGHEIVAILCGVVWGLWVGFGIVAAGTMLGEWGNFYAFKYVCQSRAEKYEKKNINYACLAHVIRHGGFFIIVAARLSAIPGHLTTAIFATCGQSIWIFSLAAFVTLPKQLVVVYLGVLFNAQVKSKKSKIISYTVLAIGAVITVLSAWYIYREMNKARIVIWRRHRVALATKGVQLNELVYDSHDIEVGGSGLRAPGEDVDSPMLQSFSQNNNYYGQDDRQEFMADGRRHPGVGEGERHSYATPYDIAYDHDGEMSIYRVEGAMEDRREAEKRVSQQLLDRRTSADRPSQDHARAPGAGRVGGAAPPSSFPVPQPHRVPSDPYLAGGYAPKDQYAGAGYDAPPPSDPYLATEGYNASPSQAHSNYSAYSQPLASNYHQMPGPTGHGQTGQGQAM